MVAVRSQGPMQGRLYRPVLLIAIVVVVVVVVVMIVMIGIVGNIT